jgi:APA family basic amino acid/polyamine antiporter
MKEVNQRAGLSFFALIMIAVGSTIGSGVFKTPTDIAKEIPDALSMGMMWMVGGLVSMIGALVFAELGGKFPKAGGVYAYLESTWGKVPAFLYGWCLMTVVSSGTIAALIIVFADFSQKLVGFDPSYVPLVAAVSVVVLTLFNTFSLKSSEWFANVATVLKMIGIFALIVVLLWWGSDTHTAVTSVVSSTTEFNWAKGFVGVLWSYTGWHYASFVTADARNPKRDVPLAMIIGTLIVTAIYLLCNAGYLHVLSVNEIQQSNTLAADAINRVIPGGDKAVSILIALSVFGCAGLYVLATPRIIQQMSSEGLFFSMFGKAHPKFGVPLNAIVLQSIWAIVLVFYWGKFESLITYVTTTEWFFLLLTALGYLKITGMQRESWTWRQVIFSLLAILFSSVVIWFIYKNAVSDNPAAYYGLLVIPIGLVVYWLFTRKSH